MTESLPLSLQEKILFLATGPLAGAQGAAQPGPATAAPLADPGKLGVQASSSGDNDTSIASRGAIDTQGGSSDAPRTSFLSPSDVFVLTSPSGPGFVVLEGFLGPTLSRRVAAAAWARKDRMKPAGMGRGMGKWAESSARGDIIEWLSAPPARPTGATDNVGPALGAALGAMAALRDELVQVWGCGDVGASGWGCKNDGDGALKLVHRMSHQLARCDRGSCLVHRAHPWMLPSQLSLPSLVQVRWRRQRLRPPPRCFPGNTLRSGDLDVRAGLG